MRFPHGLVCFGLCISLFSSRSFAAQTQQNSPTTQADPAAPFHIDYPDSTGGLEKLTKDVLKAQKNGDAGRAQLLISTMILPDPMKWYSDMFGEEAGLNDGATYQRGRKQIPLQLAALFSSALQQHLEPVSIRFEKSCDDNAGEAVFNLLHSRLTAAPIYELRFFTGNQFSRLSYFSYVDGAFRFFKAPEGAGLWRTDVRSTAPAQQKSLEASSSSRIRQGGAVQAAKLIHKVQPAYPETARQERLQGTVRFQAMIAKDGTISRMRVVKGYCSLAQAAFDAVKEWRYAPTLLMGEPIEVDTTIDVIFSLSP